MRFTVFAIAAGAMVCAGCAPENSSTFDDLPEELIQTGDAAKSVTPPHGLALYPGATVTSSMLDGVSMMISVNADSGELEQFYRAELERLGYSIAERSEAPGQITIEGISDDGRKIKLTVVINEVENAPDRFILVFGKTVPSRH